MQVNIGEAKTHFSRLLNRVEGGEEIVIAKAGRPVAVLSRYETSVVTRRQSGSMKGKIKILPGFDEVDAEIQAAFEGNGEI